jgi:hypothetical protein
LGKKLGKIPTNKDTKMKKRKMHEVFEGYDYKNGKFVKVVDKKK